MRAKFALVAILCSPLIWNSVLAQEPQDTPETGGQTAITTLDPKIPVGHLDLLLDPLTRKELLVEARGWRDLVKAKVQEISAEEIATRDKTKEIDEAQAEPSVVAPEVAEQQKKESLDTLTKLREERAALLERLKTVLDAYELKGGDPKEFRQYAAAVSGIKVEVTDTSATWSAIVGWITSKEGGLKWGIRLLQFMAVMTVWDSLLDRQARLFAGRPRTTNASPISLSIFSTRSSGVSSSSLASSSPCPHSASTSARF